MNAPMNAVSIMPSVLYTASRRIAMQTTMAM